MANPKRVTPFSDDDFIYFELQSPSFRAFDHYSEGGSYSVRPFQPSVYRLPIDAICLATAQDKERRPGEIIAVDTCQMFFVDSAFAVKFHECLDLKEGGWPNDRDLEELRKEVGVDFGRANLTSDGHYVLDLSALQRVDRDEEPESKDRPKEDLYQKVARRMRTFVCERCYAEELMESGQSYQELAQLAKDQGWHSFHPKGNGTVGSLRRFRLWVRNAQRKVGEIA